MLPLKASLVSFYDPLIGLLFASIVRELLGRYSYKVFLEYSLKRFAYFTHLFLSSFLNTKFAKGSMGYRTSSTSY
jgi:uncharacterized membrane protein